MRALGIDVGGTFTDAVLVADGEVRTAKVPTAARQEESVVAAAAALGVERRRALHPRHDDRHERAARAARRTDCVRRPRRASSTSSTSAGRRARICTGPAPSTTPPLVPLERCVGVRGADRARRASSSRSTSTRCPSSTPTRSPSAFSSRSGIPSTRRRLPTRSGAGYPSAHVVASHEVAPEFREYERASTTVVDAYLGPVLAGYLGALSEACRGAGLPEPLVMRSSGGVTTLEEAAAHAAVRAALGPGGGCRRRGAHRGARRLRRTRSPSTWAAPPPTSARSSTARHDASTSGKSTASPSACRRSTCTRSEPAEGRSSGCDEGGAVRVGPESAGADPGPRVLRARRRARDGDRRQPPARTPADSRCPAGSSSTREAAAGRSGSSTRRP